MPIFRHDGAIYFFAHVPKCGGQSVEDYLRRRFGPLAFLNNDFYARPIQERWSRSSPQHISRQALGDLFPPGWFAASFATVRHPLSRLASAYNHQALLNRTIGHGVSIEQWFDMALQRMSAEPFAHDNHLAPQNSLVPEDARIFRLEDGLDAIIGWLDELVGNSDGPREIGRLNARISPDPARYERRPLPEGMVERVLQVYARDFERFGYDERPGTMPEIFVPLARVEPQKAQQPEPPTTRSSGNWLANWGRSARRTRALPDNGGEE